jgi:tetratricopeptide (TPR) repeat protein
LIVLILAGMIAVWRQDDLRPYVASAFGVAPEPTPTWVELANRADQAYWKGDIYGAVENYRLAAEQNPDDLVILSELVRMLYYRSFLDPRNVGDRAEMLTWANAAIEEHPDNPMAMVTQCLALVANAQAEDAERYCTRAIDLDPDNANAHAYLSMALSDQLRYGESYAAAERAVQLDAQNLDAQTSFAYILEIVREPDAALDHYTNATEIHPRSEYAWFNLGGAAYRYALIRGDADKFLLSVRAYDTILSNNKRSVKAYVKLCITYYAQGETNLARDTCSTAKDVDPDYSEAWRWLGEVNYRTMEYAAAAEAFAQCVRIEGGLEESLRQPECWYYQGLAYVQMDQCLSALPIFDDLLSWTNNERAISLTNQGISICGAKPLPTQPPTPTALPSGRSNG